MEVVRVIKYDKNWNRLDASSFYGKNTYGVFHAGAVRIAEKNGSLFVHTCHTMYHRGDSSLHHQANMTFKIKISDMSASIRQQTGVSYPGTGYVSHSFDQYILVDDNNTIYRMDLGDCYPRCVFLTRSADGEIDYSVTDYADLLDIQGTAGANDTGVTLGGFEFSGTDSLMAVGTTVDQSSAESWSAYGVKNVFVKTISRDFEYAGVEDDDDITYSWLDEGGSDCKTTWLTDYADTSEVYYVYPPDLVKLDDYNFLVMWQEKSFVDTDNGTSTQYALRAVIVDDEGDPLTETVKIDDAYLSDCQPIVTEDGDVTWYVSSTRRERGIDKSHHDDAFAIANVDTNKRADVVYYYKQHRRNNRSLETFTDAKYIDSRDGKTKTGMQLSSGRTSRKIDPDVPNLRQYRQQKTHKGIRSIRRAHYKYQPNDLIRYDGKTYRVSGTHCKGKRVVLHNGSKSVSRAVTKVSLYRYNRGVYLAEAISTA